ncbi:Small RNA 2'-O-methyltransferase [Zea mays]|uniref:Small RNA 2'-O-methyltransferase n=1 Tax=Zea mays TaxID=4577 RepID=A0A1D6NLF2_MAIZE|nr:Small RNA 2'-O-methyltransferase [Zea mays]
MSRDSILVAELPSAYSRFSWQGLSPRDLLCSFCRLQRLPEPHFAVSRVSCDTLMSALSSKERGAPAGSAENQYTNDVRINKEKPDLFKCEVNIRSRKQEILLEYSAADTWSKESDAIQNSSLKVLIWFNNYFKKLTSKTGKLYLSESTADVKVHSNIFLQEFAMCLSVYGKNGGSDSAMCSAVGPFSMDTQKKHLESTAKLTHIEGPDSGVFPSHGSLTCISYTASLVTKDKAKTYLLESHNEFEFEIGTGVVSNQLESCVTQLSVNQTARFVAELPPRDLIMAASCEFSHDLSNVSSESCFLEFSVKVLQVTEPLEDRMEKALFSPPLSKQRVEFDVRHINELHGTTLVDFGCGSGSLLDSLLEHPTTLEKLVGVDISRKGLTRAAKVIEHVEEDQATLFGNIVLSSFRPTVLIVSTPNYEYNPILQGSAMPNKDDEADESTGPYKFRNHDRKFEWTRLQFQCWATGLAVKHSYSVEFSGVGGSGEELGYASQIAIFRRLVQGQEAMCLDKDGDQPYEVLWEWPNACVN